MRKGPTFSIQNRSLLKTYHEKELGYLESDGLTEFLTICSRFFERCSLKEDLLNRTRDNKKLLLW